MFERDTREHVVTVLHDDGVYRHLRCQKPGSWCYGFDVVTWPGCLAYTGDMGDYMFRRLSDMFEFFATGLERTPHSINPHYWGEKLTAPRGRSAVMEFDEGEARDWVNEWAREQIDERELDEAAAGAFLEDVDWEVLRQLTDGEGEHGFRTAIRDYRYSPPRGDVIRFGQDDYWDMSWNEYEHRFLWCCWALVWAIDKYRRGEVERVG